MYRVRQKSAAGIYTERPRQAMRQWLRPGDNRAGTASTRPLPQMQSKASSSPPGPIARRKKEKLLRWDIPLNAPPRSQARHRAQAKTSFDGIRGKSGITPSRKSMSDRFGIKKGLRALRLQFARSCALAGSRARDPDRSSPPATLPWRSCVDSTPASTFAAPHPARRAHRE